MMREIYSNKLEFITPAFLAGANQNEPEVRPASIRGELRWWFRVLGGKRQEEARVFGGVHDGTEASAAVVRVSDVKIQRGDEIQFGTMSSKGYIYYFAKKSGNDVGVYRTKSGRYLAAGTSFRLHILLRKELSDGDKALLEKAVEAFVRLGALGLRATRGCGALAETENVLSRDEFKNWCKVLETQSRILIRLSNNVGPFTSGIKCQEELGGFLKDFRKSKHLSGNQETALGFSIGARREASALHLRPVKVRQGGFLPVLIYTDAACNQGSLDRLFGGLARV